MTRQQIRTLIRTSLNEAAEKYYKDQEINDWILLTYHKVLNKMAEAFEEYFGETATTDLKASQERYALPSDFKKLVQLKLNYDGTTRIAARVMKDEIDPTITYATTDPIYTIFGDELLIKPTPSADVTGGMTLEYIKQVADIASDSADLEVPEAYHHLLVYGALAELYKKDKQLDKATLYESKYERGISDMVQELGSRDDSPKYVVQNEVGEDFLVN